MLRIAIAEDDKPTSTALTELLQSMGHEVLQASNGLQLLAMLNRTKVDLILLDMIMPDFNGWQVIETLQKIPRHKNIPIFIITAISKPDQETLLKQQVLQIFPKPVVFDQLIKEINKVPSSSLHGQEDMESSTIPEFTFDHDTAPTNI